MTNYDLENKYKELYLLNNKISDNVLIAGVDEAGRGPLAGPVVAAAVIVTNNEFISGVKDSKKLSFAKREELYNQIITKHIYSLAVISHEEIDNINILQATRLACITAVASLSISPHIVLIDGNMKFSNDRFISIIKGDNLSYSIAASSIVAKVSRDRIMSELSEEFPCYGWQQNFGYGTKKHIEAIHSHGLSKFHRKTFKIATKTNNLAVIC